MPPGQGYDNFSGGGIGQTPDSQYYQQLLGIGENAFAGGGGGAQQNPLAGLLGQMGNFSPMGFGSQLALQGAGALFGAAGDLFGGTSDLEKLQEQFLGTQISGAEQGQYLRGLSHEQKQKLSGEAGEAIGQDVFDVDAIMQQLIASTQAGTGGIMRQIGNRIGLDSGFGQQQLSEDIFSQIFGQSAQLMQRNALATSNRDTNLRQLQASLSNF